MVIFLVVLLILGAALELLALYEGLKRTEFTYTPSQFRAEPGQELSLIVTVTNHSLMPIGYLWANLNCPRDAGIPQELVAGQERFHEIIGLTFRLWSRQRLVRTIPARLMRRGVYTFGDVYLYRGDFLGLKEVNDQYDFHHQVLVYPKELESAPLRDALGSYCGDLIARRHLIRDPILTLGVREYSGQEAMKTISWSQSARRGQLMVREFDYTRDLSCTVLLSIDGIGSKDTETLDRCCSIARTVCQELTNRGVQAALYTNAPLWGYANRGIWSCNAAPGQMSDVLETLARLYAMQRCPAQELAALCTQSTDENTAFILIAGSENEAVLSAQAILRDASGNDPLLITADDPNY